MTKKYDYYADKIYIFRYGDPMVETTVNMLRNYYKAINAHVHVVKWYRCESKTVMVSVRKAA